MYIKSKGLKLVKTFDYFKDFQAQCHTTANKILDCSSLNTALTFSELKFLWAKLYSLIRLAKHPNFVDEQISSKLHKTLTNIWELLIDESNQNINHQ